MAEDRDDRIDALLSHPAEGIAVELKTWIDPRTPDGIAKIVKSVFALRNRDGGFVVIGFDDKTRLPDPCRLDDAVSSIFHPDAIQAIISKFAAQPLAIEVEIRRRDEQDHPVIIVPSGVRVPTVVRADLIVDGGKKLLREGDLYFRTFRANNTASSARILPAHYPDLMEICFNNRETDIGRFLRRQLGQTDLSALAEIIRSAVDGSVAKAPLDMLRERAFNIVTQGEAAFAEAVAARQLSDAQKPALQGLTMQVGLALEPEKADQLPTRGFLNTLAGANPQYTGWPIWVDSRGFNDEAERPSVKDGAWQALIVDLNGGWSQHLEFMRLDPRGAFYLRRAMQDDLTDKVTPGTSLDVFLMLIRVAEVLAVGVSFARAAGWEEGSNAGFAFKWTGLSGRRVGGWANPMRSLGLGSGRSSTDDVTSFVSVPVETPHAALAPYIATAVGPLFAVFDGYEVSTAVMEDAARRLVERRLS
ncbi:MAG: putative transcriptional regulator [Bradyrhizobium sp.]|nr:putative transcriptional regulator [Bradyrhizobium sp.]